MEKTRKYPNFYETLKEAEMRLSHTVVTYDGNPYYILCISDHKEDGIFRVYLDPLGGEFGPAHANYGNIPYDRYPDEDGSTRSRGKMMDKWMESNPASGVLRKHINSPLFNKFRPFPLGMCNSGGIVYYTERSPERRTQQGLSQSMVSQCRVGLTSEKISHYDKISIMAKPFADMVKGLYPTAQETLKYYKQGILSNEGVAFHRYFAFIRGPLNTIFLAYKNDVVGFVPECDTSVLRLDPAFNHLRELITELNVWSSIQ